MSTNKQNQHLTIFFNYKKKTFLMNQNIEIDNEKNEK